MRNTRHRRPPLQTRARTSVDMRVRASMRQHPARLYVFDILVYGETDIRQLPLVERKEILRASFENTGLLVYVTGIVAAGDWVFEQVKALDLEGMVGKRLAAPYQAGRSREWLKIKFAEYSRPAALGFGRTRE
nr:hypothetical protein [Paraburkholderia mimosarum]